MDFYVNPANLTSVFTLPCAVTDRYLKLAKAEHIKVIVYIMRNITSEISTQDVADNTGVDEYDVKEALLYWADAGILLPKEAHVTVQKPIANAVLRGEKPSRTDVARRGLEDPKIAYLLNEAQMKFGRNLKDNEKNTLVWLYDDEGLDVSLILMIVEYAVNQKKATIRFIESTAVDWINKGIDNLSAADEELRRLTISEQAWGIVCSLFGIEKRKPSKKEAELSYKWLAEWEISEEMLIEAYEQCINSTSKFSMPYISKVLEAWHKQGCKTVDDLEKGSQNKTAERQKASYDLELFKKMLSSKD